MSSVATMRLAIVGDSITAGYGVPARAGYAALLEAEDLPGRVLALGRDGATVRRWLPGGVHHTTLDQLPAFAPTDVLIELGLNDWYICRKPADYRDHLVQLAAEIRERAPGVRLTIWHTYPAGIAQEPGVCDIPPCTPAVPAPTWHAYGQAAWEAATTAGAGYRDSGEGRDWSRVWLADKAHLTSYGHHLLYLSLRSRLVCC